MLPSIWNNNWIDDLFDRSFRLTPWPDERELYGKHARNLMKTDVHETEDSYEMNVDLPGFKKEDVHVDLKEGYLTVRAEKNLEKEEKKEKKVIRSERYVGSMSRTFYVGDVKPESVKCRYEDGVLTLEFPKADQPKLPETHAITIE
ncbi:MAG: Hsp20/alpha crystallin family protein [Clostridia bacterium]|nr:Hsp20/alpha crystallin family protein [Clostridia bacterium]